MTAKSDAQCLQVSGSFTLIPISGLAILPSGANVSVLDSAVALNKSSCITKIPPSGRLGVKKGPEITPGPGVFQKVTSSLNGCVPEAGATAAFCGRRSLIVGINLPLKSTRDG
jgi:hypothetical protein